MPPNDKEDDYLLLSVCLLPILVEPELLMKAINCEVSLHSNKYVVKHKSAKLL